MKLINPFDRLKKRNNVPLSLFPASKKTSTTMPIGRAVPIYTIDMMQGNRLKLSVEQLTRLMELNGPLMQNYEVTVAGYFVPDVAFDHFFDSAWFRKNMTGTYDQRPLSARDFFNPATPDELRVPVAKMYPIQQQRVGNGSLWQHLGYPTLPRLNSRFSIEYIPFGSSSSSVVTVANSPLDFMYLQYKAAFGSDMYIGSSVGGTQMIKVSTFAAWLFKQYFPTFASPDGADVILVSPAFAAMLMRTVYNMDDDTIKSLIKDDVAATSWSTYFGNNTLSGYYAKYVDYINLMAYTYGTRATVAYAGNAYNLRRYLAYCRIYSDWYLNPIYTACEDFRDFVGCSYLNLKDAATYDGVLSFVNSLDPAVNKKLIADPTLKFFSEYLRNGECLPVLWPKDQFTSIVQTDAASSVAIGSTIGENFYNRMYAKFKDLVARMGRDYRSNTAALYGSKVSDSSLQRSQVIGIKSFGVQVGEIAQTSETTAESNLGSFAGYALSRDKAGLFDWTAEENGQIMIIAYVRPKYVAIGNQVDKSIYKSDYLDYLIPEFGGVGYQSVKASRFNSNLVGMDDAVIGLEERYSEYMSIPSEVSGDMKDAYSYLTSDRLDMDIYQFGTSDFYKNLYMWDTQSLHRVFQNTLYDPVALVAFFDGTVTRQLPATIRTDF